MGPALKELFMSHVHVCLVSDQPIPNLTTALQFRPDIVVLLKTKQMNEKSALLKRIISKKNIAVEEELIEAYDINKIADVSNALIDKYCDSRITLNITGGTKIGTLGTYQVFYTNDKEIFYVDTANHKILKLHPKNDQNPIPITVSIPISDYLLAHGFEINPAEDKDLQINKRKGLTDYLAATINYKPHIIQHINEKLHKYDQGSPLPVSFKLPNDEKLLKHITLLEGVTIQQDGRMKIDDEKSLMYLKGFWFEEYVYMTAKDCAPDEIMLNVTGKWLTTSRYNPKNEFDVVLSKGNRLFIISCKTANPNRQDSNSEEGVGRKYLYELESLGDRALGLFGKKIIVSSAAVSDQAVRKRAEIMGIELVDGKSIITFKENLKKWIR